MTNDINRDKLEQSFESATTSVKRTPGSQAAWDHLEEFAESAGFEEAVAKVYEAVLGSGLSGDVFETVARRAVGFVDEWFGDDPARLIGLLKRIGALDSTATWAFNRLTEMLSSAGQWDQLFAVYDRALTGTVDRARQMSLLEEASEIARDMADAPDQALTYLLKLQELDRENEARLSTIERMLEKRGSYAELIKLWRAQLPVKDASGAMATRIDIARTQKEHLNDVEGAMETLEAVLQDHPGHAEACAVLEEILLDEQVAGTFRNRAMEMLLISYQAVNQPEKVVSVLDAAISFATPEEAVNLHRRAGNTLGILGRDEAAIAHYKEILQRDPADGDAVRQLRLLSARARRYDLRAEVLLAAAEKAVDESIQIDYTLEVADLYVTLLNEREKAIALYGQLLERDMERPAALKVAYNLNELLAETGRDEDRLAVLAKIATLESTRMVRRTVLQEAAQLAAQLELYDQSIDFWNRVLDENGSDIEALGALINLMAHLERYGEMVAYLERRADAKVPKEQRRSDLVQIAGLQQGVLASPQAAKETWIRIFKEYGPRPDVLVQLDELLTALGEPELLVSVFKEAEQGEVTRLGRLFTRLGQLFQNDLQQPAKAIEYYGFVLALDPTNQQAIDALTGLLENESISGLVLERLVDAHRRAKNEVALCGLTDARVANESSKLRRAEIQVEAAELAEQVMDDAELAVELRCAALVNNPDGALNQQALESLMERTGLFDAGLKAMQAAADNCPSGSVQQLALLKKAATLAETKLDDQSTALALFIRVQQHAPNDRGVADQVIRLCAATSSFARGMFTLVQTAINSGQVDGEMIKILEAAAVAQDQCVDLANALESALSEAEGMRPEVRMELELWLADCYLIKCEDEERAQLAANRAVSVCPDRLDARRALAAIQKNHPDVAYVKNLEEIYRLSKGDLSVLLEAAKVAVDVLDDYPSQRAAVVTLYEESVRVWMTGSQGDQQVSGADASLQAVTQIAQLDLENGHKERAAHILLDGAKLPFDPIRSRFMRRKAAAIFVELGMNAVAIDVYNQVLAHNGDDVETLEDLDGLLEKETRVMELLSVRQRRLSLTTEDELKFKLRLDISRLGGLMEGSDARLAMLQENLAEQPGHRESVEALVDLYLQRGNFADLAALLEHQATALADANDVIRAAELMARSARLRMERLSDIQGAIEDWQKVIEWDESPAAVDALARLYLKNKNLEAAHQFLVRKLEMAEPEERVSVMIRLGRTRLELGLEEEAISVLAEAFELAPQNAEIRKLLFEQYRTLHRFEPLARALEMAINHVKDNQTKLAYAVEAAELLFDKLAVPAQAVRVLKTAMALDGENADIKIMYADSLLAADAFDEAEQLYGEILEGFGRRRTPQRADIHARLGQVLRAKGDLDGALENLKLAATMDTHDVAIGMKVAALANEKGDLALAEQTYRSLLMTVRREQGDGRVGPARILLELSFIAEQKGQFDKMVELQQLAIDDLSTNDAQADALVAFLEEAGRVDLLKRVLETRLGHLEKGAARARTLAALSTLYVGPLDDAALALSLILDAVAADPGCPDWHDRAAALADELGSADEYVDLLARLVEEVRREGDALTRCELLLRLISVRMDRGDELEKARALFADAEALGVREVDVMRVGARLAGALGDQEEQVRLLTALTALGASEDGDDSQLDALFRLAEIHLGQAESFDQGLLELRNAYDQSRNHERTALILRRAAKKTTNPESLLEMYERVARKSEQPDMLLEYFELLTHLPDMEPAKLKEGVALALEQGERQRAVALMEHMVAAREAFPEQGEAVAFAMLGLADLRRKEADFAGAVRFVLDAADVWEADEVVVFGCDLAALVADEAGDLVLATRLYERLLELRPQEARVFEPLSDIYLAMGNVDGFECLVEETMYSVEDPAARNGLRLKWARLLLSQEDRTDDAVDVLKNILLDDPGHEAALNQLAALYTRQGRKEELLELLQERFDEAMGKKSVDEIRGVALALGGQLEDREAQRTLYRRALEVVPEDQSLVLALIDSLDPEADRQERVALLERSLQYAADDEIGALTLRVAAAYNEMGDQESASRTLRTGYQKDSTNAEIRSALEADYRSREDYNGLVAMLMENARAIEDAGQRMLALGEVADLCRDELGDVARELDALKGMGELLVGQVAFQARYIDALRRAGRVDEALAQVEVALGAVADEEGRVSLLISRAQLLRDQGDLEEALQDLEAANEIDPAAVAEALESVLVALLEAKRQMGTEPSDEERSLVMRLSALYADNDRIGEQRSLLLDQVARDDDDVDAWRSLLAIDRASENFDGVVAACKKLTVLTIGEEQLEIGRLLTKACRKTDQLEMARRGLEYIFKENLDGHALRDELKAVYEEIGAFRELATFLAHDAKDTEDEMLRAELFRKAGDAYLKAGDPDTALLALNESLALDPENIQSVMLVVDIEIESGDLDGARAHLDAAIDALPKKRSPEMSALQWRQARISERLGDRVEQLSWLKHAVASDRKNGQVAAALADLAESMENWDTALKALRNISLMKGDCPITKADSFFRQGRIAHILGDDKKALLYVKKAIQEDRDHEEAKAFLAQIS